MLRKSRDQRVERQLREPRAWCRALACGLYVFAVHGFTPSAIAAILDVQTAAEFKKYSESAQAGDEIVIQDGFHADWGLLTLSRAGTESRPIVIRSQTPRGATLSGNVNLRILADWIVLRDLRFEGRTLI